MKKRNLYTLLLLFTFGIASSFGQEASTLYFMDKNPLRHNLNPAFQPACKFYIGMPLVSSINFNVGNNCLSFEDVFQGKTINGEKQTVSFLSKNANNGIDGFLDALHNDLRIYSDYNIGLINFGFKVKRSYITFSLSNKSDVQAIIPKAIPEVLLKGNGDIDATKSFKIEDLSVNASLYSEAAVGYSYIINDKLTLGGKLKFLYGHANLRTDFKDMSLTINKDEWKITGDGAVELSAPCVEITQKEDGTIDKFKFDDDNVGASDFAKAAGYGFAVDLGATYKLMPQLQLSASVVDLGFIRWHRNLHSLTKKTDFVFNGVVYEISDKDTVDYGKEYEEILNNMYTVDNNSSSYTSWLTAKVFLGAEYGVWDNKMTFGFLSKTYILRQKMFEEMSVSANFKPWHIFSTSLSYSLLDGCWSNLGWGVNFNFGPVNLFTAIDNIPLTYAKGDDFIVPTKTRGVNFSTGMNYVFGWKEKKKKEEKEEEKEDYPLPTVEDSLATDSAATLPESIQTDSADTADTASLAYEIVDSTIAADTIPTADTIVAPTTTAIDTITVTDTIVAPTTTAIDTIPAKDTILAPELPLVEPAMQEEKTAEDNTNEGTLWKEALYGIKFEEKQHLMVINTSSYKLLDEIANYMTSHPEATLLIKCHYSLERGEEYSRFMTREHANLVKAYLIDKDIDPSGLRTEGVGGEFPIAPENTEAGRAKNQRMELRMFE